MTWSKCVIEALDDVKSTKLECVDASGAMPENFLDIFFAGQLEWEDKEADFGFDQ